MQVPDKGNKCLPQNINIGIGNEFSCQIKISNELAYSVPERGMFNGQAVQP